MSRDPISGVNFGARQMATITTLNQTGDRSFSVQFSSSGPTDVLTFASIKDGLTAGSAIHGFIDGTPSLAAFASNSVACSVVSVPTVASTLSSVLIDATGFEGFAAGNHVLRVSLSYSASA